MFWNRDDGGLKQDRSSENRDKWKYLEDAKLLELSRVVISRIWEGGVGKNQR